MEFAVRLREAGLAVEPGDLARASSPRAIARRFFQPAVPSADRWEPIVVLRPGRENTPPLVLIHATPGDVLGYGNLAAELPDHIPCWGVVSRGLHEPNRPHVSLTAMAGDYLDILHARLGDAPFALGGWCYGGLVAYEMACALFRARRTPPIRLLLFETWSPLPRATCQALRFRALQFRTLVTLSPPHLLAYLRHKLKPRPATDLDPDESAPAPPRRSVAFQHNMAAARPYRAEPYPLPVDLFFTVDSGVEALPLPDGGWPILAPSRTAHFCEGNHASLLHPPHAARLATHIAALLANPRAGEVPLA
jgi:thioesterase domain-containing protein